ncbi:MAG TPA: 7TM-DISM domain-containing protein, partial [Cyclobacteriaceae bacterium]
MPTTCFKLLIFFLGLFGATQAFSQGDTLFVTTEEEKIDLLSALNVYSTPSYITPEAALDSIASHGYKIDKATIGFTRDTYWATLNIKNTTSLSLDKILEVSNPQIDCLQVYILSKQKILPWVLTGDKFPFQQRLVEHRNFIFPFTLQPGESKSLLLKIEKRNSSLNFPVALWHETDYHQKDYVENLGYGLYAGLIVLCALYSILIFAFLRTSIYLWYFVWVVSSGIFVFTAQGFSHQFLYPSVYDLNSIFRIIIEVLNLIAFLKFSQKFLRMEEYTPVVSKTIHGIVL